MMRALVHDSIATRSVTRRWLAGLLGTLPLALVDTGGAKRRGRHPHRPECADAGEKPTGMRKRKGRKARPGRCCCEGLVVGLSGTCETEEP